MPQTGHVLTVAGNQDTQPRGVLLSTRYGQLSNPRSGPQEEVMVSQRWLQTWDFQPWVWHIVNVMPFQE
jgi:hypothetical protein